MDTQEGASNSSDLLMEQEHKNTQDLEWFGAPERNTLRPLRVVLLFVSVDESIFCLPVLFLDLGISLAGVPLL